MVGSGIAVTGPHTALSEVTPDDPEPHAHAVKVVILLVVKLVRSLVVGSVGFVAHALLNTLEPEPIPGQMPPDSL
jgi:hypothetical protein